MIVQICVGSSCHIKGSYQIVELMKNAIEDYALEDDVVLAGCFCTGNCTREGITIQVDDDVITGVTVQTFDTFFKKNILERLKG